MRKLLLILILFLFLLGPAQAQEKIYLPLIWKGDSCMPTQWATLEITDGTDTTDLLVGDRIGFHLAEWNPVIIQPKGGGTYQDSSLASGRRLVTAIDDLANERLELKVNHYDQDTLIANLADFLQLLIKARNYWLTNWQDTPVYIRAKAECETNYRYALIHNFTLAGIDNPYAQPFFTAAQLAVMDDINLGLERGHWLANAPGNGSSVTASNAQEWDFTEGWVVFDHLGAVTDLPAPASEYRVVAVGDDGIIVGPTDTGGTDDMYYSTDDGATWAACTGGSNVIINDILKISNSYIIFSDDANSDRILLTEDQGANVSVLSTTIGGGPLVLLRDGTILSAYNGDDIYSSSDNGATWSNVGGLGTSGTVYRLTASPLTDTIIAHLHLGADDLLYRSTDSGVTWSVIYSFGTTAVATTRYPYTMEADALGYFYLIADNGDIYRSTDDGLTWFLAYPDLESPAYVLFVDSQDRLYAVIDTGGGGNTRIHRSDDRGLSFGLLFETGGEFIPTNMSESDEGDLFVGGESFTASTGGLIYNLADEQDFGTDTDGKLYVVNRLNIAQLSHVFIDDGGVFGSNLFPISASFDMYPATPAVSDAIYFGISTGLADSGPFGGLKLNITVPVNTTSSSHTIVWEYSDGGAGWPTLTVRDNTRVDNGLSNNAFSRVGVNSVHWAQPSDWAAESVNSVTAFWVRARITGVGGGMTPPTHANDAIVALILPFAEIAAAQVAGDIPALLRARVINQSDEDGRGGSGPDLWSNRIIAGLRSLSRGTNVGELFAAYLNCSDEQNPFGVSVSADTNTVLADDLTTPTGRRCTWSAGAGETSFDDRVTFTLGANIARDYYGEFHAFVRAQVTSGSADDIVTQVQVRSGSGGIILTSSKQPALQSTTAWELLDMGQIAITPDLFLSSELPDSLDIVIQGRNDSGGALTVYFFDLILIPVDEWAIDSTDFANSSDSILGRDDSVRKMLEIDSVTNPKRGLRSIVKEYGSGRITANWPPKANGEAILQANAQQRIWFLSARSSATGGDPTWLSEPTVGHSVEIIHNARYSGLRGDR